MRLQNLLNSQLPRAYDEEQRVFLLRGYYKPLMGDDHGRKSPGVESKEASRIAEKSEDRNVDKAVDSMSKPKGRLSKFMKEQYDGLKEDTNEKRKYWRRVFRLDSEEGPKAAQSSSGSQTARVTEPQLQKR